MSLNDSAFFGVVLEAWRIGDSLPAPRLRIDIKPDNWSRTIRSARADAPTAQLYRRFWGEFLPRLHLDHAKWSGVSTPSKANWMAFGSARSDLFKYSAVFCAAPRRTCRIELYLDSPTVDPADVFDWLHDRRSEIEATVDGELDWDRLDDRRACRIAAYFPDDVRIADEDRWPDLIDWFVDSIGRMKSAFDPIISTYPPVAD